MRTCSVLEERSSPNDLEAPPPRTQKRVCFLFFPITGQCLADELGLLHWVRGSSKGTRQVSAVEVGNSKQEDARILVNLLHAKVLCSPILVVQVSMGQFPAMLGGNFQYLNPELYKRWIPYSSKQPHVK